LSRTLLQLEAVIQKGQESYVEVGKAFREIRDNRLYKKSYNTFEEYCEKRWGLDHSTVKSYISATEVVENIEKNGHLSGQNRPGLTQARELAVLDPEQQIKIAATTDFANTTTKKVIDKVRSFKPKTETKVPTVPEEKTLEQWLEEQVRKIALQPYGHYAAKFEKYPWQHPTERANVEGAVLDIYKAIATICAKKLRTK